MLEVVHVLGLAYVCRLLAHRQRRVLVHALALARLLYPSQASRSHAAVDVGICPHLTGACLKYPLILPSAPPLQHQIGSRLANAWLRCSLCPNTLPALRIPRYACVSTTPGPSSSSRCGGVARCGRKTPSQRPRSKRAAKSGSLACLAACVQQAAPMASDACGQERLRRCPGPLG